MAIKRAVLPFLLLFCCFATTLGHAIPLSPAQGNLSSLISGDTEQAGRSTSKDLLLRMLNETSGFLGTLGKRRLSSQHLEQRFRSHGDIGAILQWTQEQVNASTKDDVVRALYAVALAASGDVRNARNMLSQFHSSLYPAYREMAKATIAHRERKLGAALKHAKKAISYDKSHPYSYNILGRVYAAQSQYSKAVDAFRKATQISSNFTVAYTNAGAIQFVLGHFDEAADAFSLAINQAPQNCEARYGRAIMAEVSRNYPQAIADLEACLKGSSTNLEAQKKLAYLYMRSGQLAQAESVAQQFEKEDAPYAQLLLGDTYLRMGKPAKAKQVLAKLADTNQQAAYLLAFASFLNGKTGLAIKQSRAIVNRDPKAVGVKFTNAIFNSYQGHNTADLVLTSLAQDSNIGSLAKFALANIAAAKGKTQKAMALWNKAENFLPGFSVKGLTAQQLVGKQFADEAKHLNLGVLFYIKELYSSAVKELQLAVRVNDNSPISQYFLAAAYAAMSENAKAQRALQRSLTSAPKFFSANYMLAEMYARGGEFKTALGHYLAAVEHKDDAGIFVKLGILYESEGEFDKAQRVYGRFIKSYPDNYVAYNQLAWLYAKRGIKLDESLNLASKADVLQPNNAGIQDTLGWVYFQKRDYQKALQHLRRASLVSNERNPQILFHIASVQYEMGERKNARQTLERAFSIADQFDDSDKARRLLDKLR